MLRLVRWMLAYHDRHPYSAPLTLVLLAQVISVLPVLAGIGLLSLLHINEDLAVFMMAPWVIYIAPFYWASVLLSVERLCCTNPVWDSSRESSVIAGGHEQTEHTDLPHPELARV